MILVDIQVPVLRKVFDFELDEESKIEILTEDILVLIAEQEHLTCKREEEMCLYALRLECVLKRDKSLMEQGVRAGDRLILF